MGCTFKCLICGDQAYGYNFGVISCNSCKQFFRRNVDKYTHAKCNMKNHCLINTITRKFCIKCRLDKCVKLGMKKECIIIVNECLTKGKRNPTFDSSTGATQLTTSYANEVLSVTVPDMASNRLLITHYINDYRTDISHSKTIDFSDTTPNIGEQEQSLSDIPIPTPHIDYVNSLNELEGNWIQELISATNVYNELWEQPFPSGASGDFAHAIADRFESYIQASIQMCQKLSPFNELCQNDRISLIKYGSVDLFILRSLPFNDTDINNWAFTMDNDEINVKDVGDSLRGLHLLIKKFMINICREWESDALVLDLLTAIILFNPNRAKLTHNYSIKHHQQVYTHLLRRYLAIKYNDESQTILKVNRIEKRLQELHVLGQYYWQTFREVDPKCVKQDLLREIFDLN